MDWKSATQINLYTVGTEGGMDGRRDRTEGGRGRGRGREGGREGVTTLE